MQESIISWTNQTWNPMHGCSKVSAGCARCYAMTISLQKGFTHKPWTIQNEAANVQMKPHKLNEPFKLKTPQRIFVNSMSDMFHRQIPDWYKAVIFCIMLDLPQHVFQVLTKRAYATIHWHTDFVRAIKSPQFKAFAGQVKDPRIKAALNKTWDSPWADHIWMGTSIEDSRVLSRIDDLRQSKAQVRFVSAEPLLGAWGPVDLTGIHWVIVGGESGRHIKDTPDRYMKQAWAREIKNACVDQGVAYFYKQDSGYRTELRPWLVEADGSRWKWEQYPNDLKPPVLLLPEGRPAWNLNVDDVSDEACLNRARHYQRQAFKADEGFYRDNYALLAAYWYQAAATKRQKDDITVTIQNTDPTPQPEEAPVIAEPVQMSLFDMPAVHP